MEQHIKILAILNIVLGALGVLIALIALIFFGGLAGVVSTQTQTDPDAAVGAAVLGMLGGLAFLILAVLSAPALIAGIGLLQYRSWAQTLTLIVSVIHLFNIPFGTALGIYGLWVFLKDETKALIKARNPA
jgi:hypothetical protein